MSERSPATSSSSGPGRSHAFENVGDVPLVQLDVHVSERFIQENLD